jgi:FMN phosphatase YigB (HAD superfamily)
MRANQSLRFVFFDLMETLVGYQSNEHGYLSAICTEAERLGYGPASSLLDRYIDLRLQFRKVLAEYRESTLSERLRALLPDAPGSDVDRLIQVFREFFAANTKLMPGASDMLDAWKGKARLAVVSNFFVAGMPKYMALEASSTL